MVPAKCGATAGVRWGDVGELTRSFALVAARRAAAAWIAAGQVLVQRMDVRQVGVLPSVPVAARVLRGLEGGGRWLRWRAGDEAE